MSDWFWLPGAALLLSHLVPPNSLVAPGPRHPVLRQTWQLM